MSARAAAFLPHLRTQPGATLVNVSSGLAFVPMARAPIYCATKAAVHSWTLSLHHQLRNSGVAVLEVIPPWVQTELGGMGKGPGTYPPGRGPMPLGEFIAEAMQEFESGAEDVVVGSARNLVAAAGLDTVRKAFAGLNAQW